MLRLAALALVLMLVSVAQAAAEVRHALVIGNSGYAVGALANPRNDAEAIAKALQATGFKVVKLIDADQQTMRRAVLEFGRRLREPDAVGLLYYAGHGVQVAGENFLVPIGADIKDEGEVAVQSLNLAEVLKTMTRAQAGVNIVILDACRNNPFESASRGVVGGLAPVNAPAGTLIAFATAPGQVALDGEGANSPYSSALAQAIPTPGIVLEEVFRRTRRAVLTATGGRQTPWEHSSLTGEFFFRPKTAEPETSARPDANLGLAEAEIEEIRAWDKIKDQRDPAVMKKHLETYPGGVFADLARLRIEQAKAAPTGMSGTVAGWIGSVFGGAQDDPEALKLYEEGLKVEAKGTPEADTDAVRLYRAAAGKGLPAAMYQLARAYDRGKGTEKSLVEAAVWYRRAADLGHAGAMASLGTMLEFGETAPVDLVEALRLYRLAADQGDANGMASLGYLYQQGKGVARDGAEARRWYAKAAAAGNARAMFNLALMHVRGEGGERNFGEAVRYLNAAIEKGHVGAMREIAFLFDEGRGVGRDPRSAADYLLAAYKSGHKDARMDLLVHPEAWSVATRREIQKRLAAAGLYDGPTGGFFDVRTRRALEAYGRGAG